MPGFLTLVGVGAVLKTMVFVGMGVALRVSRSIFCCKRRSSVLNELGLDGPEDADDLAGVPTTKEPFCEPAPFAPSHREVVEDRTFEFTPFLVLNDDIW